MTPKLMCRIRANAVVSAAALVMAGCGADQSLRPSVQADATTVWAVRLNEHAVTLSVDSPHNTIALNAMPVSITNVPLPESGIPTITSRDSAVSISSNGVVTANFVTPPDKPAVVIAILTHHGVTLVDTTLVKVTQHAPISPLATFSIQPANGDSAKLAASDVNGPGLKTIPVIALDMAGDTIANAVTDTILTYFTSSNRTIATIDRAGNLRANVAGYVTLHANAVVYGVARHDSVRFAIGYPLSMEVVSERRTPIGSMTSYLAFNPSIVTISVGGAVTWSAVYENADLPLDVVFDDPSAAQPACGLFGCDFEPESGSGNIAPFFWRYVEDPFLLDLGRARAFHKAGTYSYHSALYGTTGKIVVKADP